MVLDISEQEFTHPFWHFGNISDDTYELSELVECEECGSKIEFTRLSPLILVEIE